MYLDAEIDLLYSVVEEADEKHAAIDLGKIEYILGWEVWCWRDFAVIQPIPTYLNSKDCAEWNV